MTLVSAPAGSGKTTLLAEWASDVPESVAWLSLEEGDNSPAGFLKRLLSTLRPLAPGLDSTAGVLAAGAATGGEPEMLEQLLRTLAVEPGKRVLVLDDYHVIEDARVHRLLETLVGHQPEGLHVVISSRSDPPLPLSRLRLQRELREIREDDLRFTPDEARELLNRVLGLDLTADDVASLHDRTEGWAAGLQLAGLWLRQTSDPASRIDEFSGEHRFVVDYLVDEVLGDLPESTRNFLLRTSILDQLSAPLCEVVSGEPEAQDRLESIERSNLFLVPLDPHRSWYRYHRLFRDLLVSRAERSLGEKEVQRLHSLASDWLDRAGSPGPALRHALAAGDPEGVRRLLEQSWRALVQRGERFELAHVVDALPEASLVAHPHLLIAAAWVCVLAVRREKALHYMSLAMEVLEGGLDDTVFEGKLLSLRAFLAIQDGRFEEAGQSAERALELLPEDERAERALAALHLGLSEQQMDQFAAAKKHLSYAAELGEVVGEPVTAIPAYGALARNALFEGLPREGLWWCTRALERCELHGWLRLPLSAALVGLRGEARLEMGDAAGIADLESSAERLRQIRRLPRGDRPSLLDSVEATRRFWAALDGEEVELRTFELLPRRPAIVPLFERLSIVEARICFQVGAIDAVGGWLDSVERERPEVGQSTEILLRARYRLALGESGEALESLEQHQVLSENSGRAGEIVEGLLLQAAARTALGDSQQARIALERAIELAAKRETVRPFLEHGSLVASLLERYSSGEARRFLEPILGRLRPADEAPVELLEPLSRREREVLELVCLGLSNREIAERLFVSLNTVKTHLRNVYGKLGVSTRTQAISRAANLRLH